MMYFLPRPSARTTMSPAMLDRVRESSFRSAKVRNADPEKHHRQQDTERDTRQIELALAAKQTPAETVYHTDERVETVPETPMRRYNSARKADRRDIEQQLNYKRNDVAKIAILHVKRGHKQ